MILRLINFITFYLLTAAACNSQVFEFPSDVWGKADLNLSQSTVSGAESILGTSAKWEELNDFPPSSRERRFSRPVGRLEIRYGGTVGVCTAFLISKDQLMTNHHCIPADGTPIREAMLFMGYYNAGSLEGVEKFEVEITPRMTSKALDFSVLGVRGEPGSTWGWLEFAPEKPSEGDRLMVIHHPAGQIKHITMQGCVAGRSAEGDRDILLHRCDTVPGSSGSPLLNQDGDVVALHYAGTPLKGDGAFNFSKFAVSINKVISEGTPPEPVGEVVAFTKLGLETIFETYVGESLELNEELVRDCESLIDVREIWVPEEDIGYFFVQAEKCFSVGAISKFVFEQLEQKTEKMRKNFSTNYKELSRVISCPTLLADLAGERYRDWNLAERMVAAYCGLDDPELSKLRAYLRSKLTENEYQYWLESVEHSATGLAPSTAERSPPNREQNSVQQLTGLDLSFLTVETSQRFNIPDGFIGAFVSSVRPGSLADEAGVKKGDVIYSIDQSRILTLNDALEALSVSAKRNLYWELSIVRAGKTGLFYVDKPSPI